MVTKPSQTRGGEGGGVLSSTELQKNWTIVFPMLMKICRWRLYREEYLSNMPMLSKDEQKLIHPMTTVLALSVYEKKQNC